MDLTRLRSIVRAGRTSGQRAMTSDDSRFLPTGNGNRSQSVSVRNGMMEGMAPCKIAPQKE